MISVIVPACNEGRVIGRLLSRLVSSAGPDELEVLVVANGCTDDTVEVASRFGPPVRVLTVAAAAKPAALAEGDQAASGFPRIYLDADVELGTADLRALAAALERPGVLAAAPEREIAMAGRPWPIRWYYDVWTRLPEVRRGLFGRGVIAFSKEGHARVTGLQPLLADDLAVSLSFGPDERAVVPAARVLIHPPRTLADLLRRRVRAAEGIAQINRNAGALNSRSAQTRSSDLLTLARREPQIAPRVAFFLVVAIVAKYRARRTARHGNYSRWLRDESSRR
jgi:glycosyltransferase involved in cell wall biosynthesis